MNIDFVIVSNLFLSSKILNKFSEYNFKFYWKSFIFESIISIPKYFFQKYFLESL